MLSQGTSSGWPNGCLSAWRNLSYSSRRGSSFPVIVNSSSLFPGCISVILSVALFVQNKNDPNECNIMHELLNERNHADIELSFYLDEHESSLSICGRSSGASASSPTCYLSIWSLLLLDRSLNRKRQRLIRSTMNNRFSLNWPTIGIDSSTPRISSNFDGHWRTATTKPTVNSVIW